MRIKKDVVIIGGGPAGMSAAASLKQRGIENIILLEKENRLGGVLSQCIHDGFGLVYYHKNYAGPEYSALYEKKIEENGIAYLTEATVLSVGLKSSLREEQEPQNKPESQNKSESQNKTESQNKSESQNKPEPEEASEKDRIKENPYTSVVSVQTAQGLREYEAEAVIVASGCRERGRGLAGIPGTRPAGIYTAGTAQALMNLQNYMPGHKAVIVGSGDIGLIMARRITLEGGQVLCVAEKEDVPGGLRRNIIQCLEDYEIPLFTNSVVSNVYGKERITGVDIAPLDTQGKILADSARHYDCDLLILSVGLIPEEDMVEDRHPGVFLCGNALYVHDLVDDVSLEGEMVAGQVETYLMKLAKGEKPDETRYSFPGIETMRQKRKEILARKKEKARKKAESGEKTITCIMCPNGCEITYDLNGGMCGKGPEYVKNEILNPKRMLTSSVKVEEGALPLVSVKTTGSIPKEKLFEAMDRIAVLRVKAPVELGQVIEKDFMEEGIDLIATKSVGVCLTV